MARFNLLLAFGRPRRIGVVIQLAALAERLQEAPDLGWKAVEGAAHEKLAKALSDYAEEESQKVDTELKKRTLDNEARQEKTMKSWSRSAYASGQANPVAIRGSSSLTNKGVTNPLQDLLDDSMKLKDFIVENWDKYCAAAITAKVTVALTGKLKSRIETFDYGIFHAKQPHELIDEHSQTPYHLTVFGSPLINRPPPPAPPSTVAATHVAQNIKRSGGSAIDQRTTRHEGYAISRKKRKRIEESFGWLKDIALMRKVKHRGIAKVGWVFTFAAAAAYNLVRAA